MNTTSHTTADIEPSGSPKEVSPEGRLVTPTHYRGLTGRHSQAERYDQRSPHVSADRRPTLRWLTTQLGSYLDKPPTAIDPRVPLAEMGVDSVHAISLVGDIEVRFDIDVDPTLIFDYPTLSDIAEYIGTALAEQQQVA
jgi:acyl carrier protein